MNICDSFNILLYELEDFRPNLFDADETVHKDADELS